MQGQQFWILAGAQRETLEGTGSDVADKQAMDRQGAVRVTTGTLGTEIRWSVFSPSYTSLFALLHWLPQARLPVVLRFYLSGWFEEFCYSWQEARNRIEQIMAKSELHLTRRTFVEEVDPRGKSLPPLIAHVWHEQSFAPDMGVDCVFDETSQRFRVNHIGSKSTIAKFYGVSRVSYPCANNSTYDATVCQGYERVLASGRPRYDHVLAAMRMPDNVIRWVSYQRVIMPKRVDTSQRGVSIFTEIAPVDIHPL